MLVPPKPPPLSPVWCTWSLRDAVVAVPSAFAAPVATGIPTGMACTWSLREASVATPAEPLCPMPCSEGVDELRPTPPPAESVIDEIIT